MPRFKIGDKVLAVQGNDYVQAGSTGKVLTESDTPRVSWDKYPNPQDNEWYIHENKLELVRPICQKRRLFNRKTPTIIEEIRVYEPTSWRVNPIEPIHFLSFMPRTAETKTTMSVTQTIKRLALKATNPNEVAKRDAGLHDDCGNLTDAGRDALLGILETQVDAQFTQLANDINAENKSKAA